MKRLLGSTAALSVALMNVQPWPLFAQTLTEAGTVIAADGTVLCQPTADLVCDPDDAGLIEQARAIEARMAQDAAAQAKAEAQAQADAAAAAEAEAQSKADADAAAKAEALAKADADAAAAAEVQAKADADAAAAAEVQAKADADAAAASAEEQTKADNDAAAKAQAKADADAAAAQAETQAIADAEAAALAKAAAQAKADADAAAATEAQVKVLAEPVVKPDETITDAAAGLKTAQETIDPTAPLVAAPVVSAEEAQTLSDLLTQSPKSDSNPPEVVLPLALTQSGPQPTVAAPSTEAVTTTTEVVTEKTTRRATQEFTAAPQVVEPGKKNRLSDLEKAGLFVLGALVVGTIINQTKQAGAAERPQQQVVSNTGDRVVVLKPDGTYQVYKDDDALLHRPGNTLRTESYRDGSSRTIVDRPDGAQIVTIRDATGRVLRRVHYDNRGHERVLIDDLEPERVIVLSSLPKARNRPIVISPQDRDVALKVAMAERQIKKIGRSFSLRQVRDIPQVRHLAALIDVDNITFASGSSALSATEVDALSDLGALMQDILDTNPDEIFLIEGHTDAVGENVSAKVCHGSGGIVLLRAE